MQSTGQTDAHELHDVQLSLLITFRYRVSFFRSAFRVRKYSVIEMVMIGVLWINVHKKHGLRQSLPAKHREIRLRQRAPVRRADRIPIDPTANHLGWPLRSTKIALWPSDFLWLRRILPGFLHVPAADTQFWRQFIDPGECRKIFNVFRQIPGASLSFQSCTVKCESSTNRRLDQVSRWRYAGAGNLSYVCTKDGKWPQPEKQSIFGRSSP